MMISKLTPIALSLGMLLVSNNGAVAASTAPQMGKMYVGYWNNLNTNTAGTKANPPIAQTARAGYTIIPIAFGVIQGTTVSLYDNGWNNQGYGVDQNKKGFLKDIAAAHDAGAIVLLSFGGGSDNTFSWNPDLKNPELAANNVVAFLAEHNLDGMDFDIEAGMNQDPAYLAKFISQLRKTSASRSKDFPNGFYISGAPQFMDQTQFQWNGWNKNTNINSLLSATACNNQHCFDFLSIQNYNNNQLSLSTAYKTALNQLNANNNNGKTAIIIGYPATPVDGRNYLEPSVVSSQLSALGTSLPQFGGIMLWTASGDFTDQRPSWKFISTINTNQPPAVITGEEYFVLKISNSGPDQPGKGAYTTATLVVNGNYLVFANQWNQPLAPGANQSWGNLASSQNPDTPYVKYSESLDNMLDMGGNSFIAQQILVNGYQYQSLPVGSPTVQTVCPKGTNYEFKLGHTYNLMLNGATGACDITQVN